MPNEARKYKNKQEHGKDKGVAMAMKFRSHQDPLYYDPAANDKIFVPMMPEVSLLTSSSLIGAKRFFVYINLLIG